MMLALGSRDKKVKTLQRQLNILGYALSADGIFGPATRRAVMDLQQKNDIAVDGLVGRHTTAVIDDALSQTVLAKPASEHFSYEEFVSKNDAYAMENGIPQKYWGNIQTLMERLELVRAAIGNVPIVIRSGYRSPTHNKAVGGAKNSQHLYGKAADIYVLDDAFSCYELASMIYFDDALKQLFGGFGLGSNTNLHLDIRSRINPLKPAFWWYGKKSWEAWGKL